MCSVRIAVNAPHHTQERCSEGNSKGSLHRENAFPLFFVLFFLSYLCEKMAVYPKLLQSLQHVGKSSHQVLHLKCSQRCSQVLLNV